VKYSTIIITNRSPVRVHEITFLLRFGLMEERGELLKQLSRRKKPGVRIAGHSETSILGHPGRFEYSARQSELRFLSGTRSIVHSFFKHENDGFGTASAMIAGNSNDRFVKDQRTL
jgi:hypothetical protein